MDWGVVENDVEFHAKTEQLMNKHFPMKTITYKDTDDPWINKTIRKKKGNLQVGRKVRELEEAESNYR